MPGKCSFNFSWLTDLKYKDWLRSTADKYKARCGLCSKTFDITNMGESALKVHMKGKKHCQALKDKATVFSLPVHFQPEIKPDPVETTALSIAKNSSAKHSEIESYCKTGLGVTRAEILWGFKCVSSHISYKSCEKINLLFRKMFPDSDVAANFTCGESKCAYLCSFGIAPYLKSLLEKTVTAKQHYVLLFDESLNRRTQSKQMDIHIRFWDDERNEVTTRYFNSAFFGHSTSVDIMDHFMSSVSELNLSKLLQISMDGPAVNWKFYNMLKEKICHDLHTDIINAGSCGLHQMHNAFRHGALASNWHIEEFLNSMYYLFKNSPARQEDFLTHSKGKFLPVKFCTVRWLSNVPAAERAIAILSDVRTYVSAVEKKELPKPQCRSFDTVRTCVKDILLPAKMNFFLSFANIIQPFLTHYQSDKPLFPFFAEDTRNLIQKCFVKYEILKKETLANCGSLLQMLKLDFKNVDILTNPRKVCLGFETEKIIKNLLTQQSISEKDVVQFKLQCRCFITTFLQHLLQKSPVNLPVVRNLSCLDPREMAANKDTCKNKLKKLLLFFLSSNHLNERTSDEIFYQYCDFLDTVVSSSISAFQDFKPNNVLERLDCFLNEHLSKKSYPKLWEFVKMVLILSHGQATVERGFSINRKIEVENMYEQTYISHRLMKEYVHFVGGIDNISIDKELCVAAAGASRKHKLYLETKQKQKLQDEGALKRKQILTEIEELSTKKKRLQIDIEELDRNADEFARKAEEASDLTFVVKSNCLRKRAKEKKMILSEVTKHLAKLESN